MLINRREVRIRWAECDPAGIVFYPRYFEMFDVSTTTLFERALGQPAAAFFKAYGVVGYPLVDARSRFILPCKFSDDVVIETEVAEFRRSSFIVNHRVLKQDELAVEGVETRVWAVRDPNHPERLRSAPIPADVIARLSSS